MGGRNVNVEVFWRLWQHVTADPPVRYWVSCDEHGAPHPFIPYGIGGGHFVDIRCPRNHARDEEDRPPEMSPPGPPMPYDAFLGLYRGVEG
jgi:hypothetical protein